MFETTIFDCVDIPRCLVYVCDCFRIFPGSPVTSFSTPSTLVIDKTEQELSDIYVARSLIRVLVYSALSWTSMPTVTTTLEDTSPLLTYSANWQAGTSGNDNLADSYSQSSFTLTQKQGATMSFAFYGTSVTVYGARRSNHGNYMGQLDNNPASPSNGDSSSPLFNQVLFSSSAALGNHNLTITNNDNAFFDVDYVSFESSVGQDNEDLIVNTFKDTHPAFTYNPVSSWKTPANVGLFMGGSGHATTDPSAVATFNFQVLIDFPGDAVALYGPVGPNSSTMYSVQVDNHNPSFFSANKEFYRPQQVLYFAANLGSGQHSLKIQTGAAAVQDEFAIDYATVYTTRSLGGSFLVTDSSKTVSQIPPGAIAGLAFTTTVAILTSLLSVFLVVRQRHNFSIPGLSYKRKPKVGVQGPEFAQPFLAYPSLERAESGRSARSAGANSQVSSSSQISSRPPTSFTVPVSMTMTMTTSNAPSQSVMGAQSDIYAPTSFSYPDAPVSVSQGSVGSGRQVQGTSRPTRSEKRRTNPAGSSVQNYDQPSASGPQYVGLQLPEKAVVSPTPTTAPPPEYTQKDHNLRIANQ